VFKPVLTAQAVSLCVFALKRSGCHRDGFSAEFVFVLRLFSIYVF